MNIFPFKKIILLFLLFLFFLSLFLFTKNFKQDFFTRKSYFLVAEAQVFISSVQKTLSSQIKKYFFLLHLREENKRLKLENQKLQVKQQLFEETLEENRKWRELIDFPKKQDMKLLVAQVISYDLLSQKHVLIVNRGSTHGVKKFMGVLHPAGVVGFVFRVSPHSSQILTLKHSLSSLPVRNKRNRRLGLLFSSSGEINLHFSSQDLVWDQISQFFKKGDPLITTAFRPFPSGLLVGSVDFVKLSSSERPKMIIKPSVQFEFLEELFILLEPFEHPFIEENLSKNENENES